MVSRKGLQLTATELDKLKRSEFIGMPLGNIKGAMASSQVITPGQMPGIPIDSTNNELADWIRSVTNAYRGGNQRDLEKMLLVKGDNSALYPVFKQVKQAFKNNEIYKFRIVTNSEDIPAGSELAKKARTDGLD
jgi:hypothetical protein